MKAKKEGITPEAIDKCGYVLSASPLILIPI
jgi:hypothetical protein